jgi:hypothetical protein
MLPASGAIRTERLLRLSGAFKSRRSATPAVPQILQVTRVHRPLFTSLVRELVWKQTSFIETRIGPLMAGSRCSRPVVALVEALMAAKHGLSALIPAHPLDHTPDGVAG